MGQFLYSARGSQSAGISQFYMEDYSLDPNDLDSTFIYDVSSEKWGNFYYHMRPGFALTAFGGDLFKDREMG